MQVNGKEYQYKYISANLFIKAMKPLRAWEKHRSAVVDVETPEEEFDKHAEGLIQTWKEFCELVFEGEAPLEASISDCLEVILPGFFGLRSGTTAKPNATANTSANSRTPSASR